MSLITAVAELREPFMWQPIGVEGHYKIIPGIEKDETLDGMVDILSMIHLGDAEILADWLYQIEEEYGEDGIDHRDQPITKSMAQHMEASQ